ncbi:MAG: TVP38/TMEM64 family protein [Deltaproteobacteria bacterium]|nr:TVP38/TMEM64 family protein [Deltaproteobacteria bacterium]
MRTLGSFRLASRLAILTGLVAVPLLVASVCPTGTWIGGTIEWVRGAGLLGAGLYALAFLLAAVALVPKAVLTLGAGFAWGPLWGTLLAVPTSTGAALVAFLLGQTLAREWVARRIEGHPRFQAIDAAIAEDGFRVVLLLRLSPVLPYGLLNYALGLSRVRARDFFLATLVGVVPLSALYAWLGSLLSSVTSVAAGETSGSTALEQALLAIGFATTAGAAATIAFGARRSLARELQRRRAKPSADR